MSEKLAREFHERYETLAPSFGYETRREYRAFDPDSANGRLMRAVCQPFAAALDAKDAEIARLEADKAFVEQMLGNLLAVIHRDGGHHQGTVGTPIAVDEAMQAIYALRARLADAERDAARYRWLTSDHDDPWVRRHCRELIERMGTMSYSATSAAIDAAVEIDAARGGA